MTGRGHNGSYSSHVGGNRRDGLTRSQTVTTQSGRILNRSSTTTYDRQTHAFERSVTAGRDRETRALERSVTGPGGHTRTGMVTLTPDP